MSGRSADERLLHLYRFGFGLGFRVLKAYRIHVGVASHCIGGFEPLDTTIYPFMRMIMLRMIVEYGTENVYVPDNPFSNVVM